MSRLEDFQVIVTWRVTAATMHRRAIDHCQLPLILALLLSISFSVVGAASNENQAVALSGTKDIGETKKNDIYAAISSVDINPHWDRTKCGACHLSEPQKGKPSLRYDDDKALCLQCHSEDVTHKYIHPAGIEVPASFRKRAKNNWRSTLRLDDQNRLVCQTCHNLLHQCLKGRSYMARLNPRFLREGPYRSRTEICYKCHDPSGYKKLVPHDQIAKNGTLKLNKCRLCHVVEEKGPIKSGIKRDLKRFPFINNLGSDRISICVRCHKKIDHPSNKFKPRSLNTFRHFIKITDEKKTQLDEMKKKTGIYMPLEPDTGRIYCGTCHEAHQAGVFAGEAKTSMAGTEFRLRADKICSYCHDK